MSKTQTLQQDPGQGSPGPPEPFTLPASLKVKMSSKLVRDLLDKNNWEVDSARPWGDGGYSNGYQHRP